MNRQNHDTCEDCLREAVARAFGIRQAWSDALGAGHDLSSLLATPAEQLGAAVEDLGEDLDLLVETTRSQVASYVTTWSVCRHSENYPQRLRALDLEGSSPAVLFGVGDVKTLTLAEARPGPAFVGARRASGYGRDVAFSLAGDVVEMDAQTPVISGMALGIDGAAHRGAMRAEGHTIAVLATGPEHAYPRSHRILHEQIQERGCVISEQPPGSEIAKTAFIARNRIIAALSGGVVVVEAALRSGSEHAVNYAEACHRAVGAVPGPVTSPLSHGPNLLLRQQRAAVVRDSVDLDALIGGIADRSEVA